MLASDCRHDSFFYAGWSKIMGKIMLGLVLGFLIGVACRCFDIPLPSPPKLIGALVVLSLTLGYVGMDYLLARQAKRTGRAERPATTGLYCGGPTGIPLSHAQTVHLSENASSIGTDRDSPE
jgi:XapX domain-containing protein